MNKTHHVRFDYNPRLRALSSAGERCLHTAEVTGSIPVAPTPGRLVDLIRSLLFLVLISACGGFTPPQEGDLLTVYYELSVARLLDGLEIAPEHRSGYQRDLFPHWSDEDGDGCDTRREVLIRDARSDLLFSDFDNCRIGSGVWYSPYDGASPGSLGFRCPRLGRLPPPDLRQRPIRPGNSHRRRQQRKRRRRSAQVDAGQPQPPLPLPGRMDRRQSQMVTIGRPPRSPIPKTPTTNPLPEPDHQPCVKQQLHLTRGLLGTICSSVM